MALDSLEIIVVVIISALSFIGIALILNSAIKYIYYNRKSNKSSRNNLAILPLDTDIKEINPILFAQPSSPTITIDQNRNSNSENLEEYWDSGMNSYSLVAPVVSYNSHTNNRGFRQDNPLISPGKSNLKNNVTIDTRLTLSSASSSSPSSSLNSSLSVMFLDTVMSSSRPSNNYRSSNCLPPLHTHTNTTSTNRESMRFSVTSTSPITFQATPNVSLKGHRIRKFPDLSSPLVC